MKDEERAGRNQRKSDRVIPSRRLLQVQHRETGKHDQGDPFLNRLELRGAVDNIAQRLAGTASQYSKKVRAGFPAEPVSFET